MPEPTSPVQQLEDAMPLVEAKLELAEAPERFLLTVTMIVSCRPSLIESVKQRACEACAGAFLHTEVAPLQSNANHFRYQPDPRNQ